MPRILRPWSPVLTVIALVTTHVHAAPAGTNPQADPAASEPSEQPVSEAPASEDPAADASPSPTAPKAETGETAAPSEPSAADSTTITNEQAFEKSALGVTMKVRGFELANGLRVYVLEDHSTPAIALHLGFDVGSRDEPEGKFGFAHFFEHMMFKGSENVAEGGHFDYLEAAGADLNAFTDAETTQYHEAFPSSYLEPVLWLEADRMRSLAITEDNVDNQRNAIKEEKAGTDNQPYANAIQAFTSRVWTGTGYAHPVIGTETDLDAATPADFRTFFERYYGPNNAVLTLVGDVDYDRAKALVARYFGDIPSGPEREPYPAVDHSQTAPLEQQVEDPLARQPLLLVGWKMVPADHPDYYAATLLMYILLRGDAARITKILKDEEQLVMAAMAVPPGFLGGGSDAGAAYGVYVPMQGAANEDIKAVVKREVAKVRRRGVSAKELEKARNQLTVDTMNELATNDGRSLMITQNVLHFDDPVRVLTNLENYQAVTRTDIKRVAKQYLTDNWLVLEINPKR